MDVFNSTWLVNMLAKSSKLPKNRVLNLFDILFNWINTADVDDTVRGKPTTLKHLNAEILASSVLVHYLSTQTRAIGATHPIMLAEQIALIACNAAHQQMLHPKSHSLMHAKKAAEALIQSQASSKFSLPTPLFATLCACAFSLSLSLVWFWPSISGSIFTQSKAEIMALSPTQKTETQIVIDNKNAMSPVANKKDTNALTANDAAMMYAKYEQMRNSTCQFIEVLQIPDKHKSIYLEHVVGGKIPTNLEDLKVANHYLEKVRCNITPMLMAKSK
jgi:hypothetical protein